MNCCCSRRRADSASGVPVAAGEYQVITLGTAEATGAVSRRRVELGRTWRSLTVVELPDSVLAAPVYLHLGETDPGIRLVHRGQVIRVPDGFAGAVTSGPHLSWSGDNTSGIGSDIELLASDGVVLEIDPPGPTSETVQTGTISADGDTSLGAAAADVVARWAVHLDVDGTFDGTITFQGRVDPSSGALVSLHYIDLSDGQIGTSGLTADAIVLVDATGLGDVVITCSGRTAGSVEYYARPVRG